MAAFEYTVLTDDGKQSRGVMEADSARQLRQVLRDKGLTPLSVEAARNQSAQTGSDGKVRVGRGRKLGHLDRVLLTRQLATLVASSLPIEEALHAVAQQSEKRHVASLVHSIRSKVLEGHSLAGSLRGFPNSFSDLYCSSVAAGEQSGFLDKVLDNLAAFLEREFESRRSIEMAMIYPVALLIVALGIVGALMIFVVPEMVTMIEDLGSTLPWYTTLLINITDVLIGYWYLLLGGGVGIVVLTKSMLKLTWVRLWWDRQKFRLPLIARITRGTHASRYSSTLAILTGAGVPVVDSMKIASEVVTNTFLKGLLLNATQTVSEGSSVRAALENVRQFPAMVLHMVGSGEESGELPSMLQRVAVFQQTEVERLVGALVKLFEPLMLLLMGGVVLMIVMAVLMPILSMNQLV